ncbi:MAG: polysaccharide deacetylase family protein [Gammaproteobacteria bacterium]|nr:polysaccharide deacetylase family protein [Gammaproteobacteria bacterium]
MVHRMQVDEQSCTGTSPDHLRRCLTYLKDHDYQLLSLEALIDALHRQSELLDNAVVFTMDDGYMDQALVAAPIFLEFDCPLTFFVITDMVDQQLWPWDAKISWAINESKQQLLRLHLDDEIIVLELGDVHKQRTARNQLRDIIKELATDRIPEILDQVAQSAAIEWPTEMPQAFTPMTWDIARQLEDNGIRFAPHSKSHRILSKVNESSIEDEIMGSWYKLKQELSNPLKVFCYPTGRALDFGPREIELLKKEAFLGAVSTFPGFVQATMSETRDKFRLPRYELPDNMVDFIQYCSWIEQAKVRTRWKRL